MTSEKKSTTARPSELDAIKKMKRPTMKIESIEVNSHAMLPQQRTRVIDRVFVLFFYIKTKPAQCGSQGGGDRI